MILGLALPLFVSALALPGSLLGQVQPQQVWSATAGGTGAIPKAMALDASGNIVVAGYDAGDYLTAKFDSNGNLLWSARENGRVGDIALAPGVTAVALDAAGNVYVTGGLGGSRSYTVTYCFFTCTTYHLNASDQVTVKYSSNGHRQWISTYYEPGDNSFYGNAIAVDGSGNAYVPERRPSSTTQRAISSG